MREVTFYISDDDLDRLFIVKDKKGKFSWTGNEFAKEILVNYLHREYPYVIEYDEEGNIIIK